MSSVVDIKKTTRNVFVTTDGSRTQIDPLMTKTSYFYDIMWKNNEKREVLKRQVISGFTCMEHDRLFELANEKQLLPGDQIVYHKVGAYTMCLTPLFIKWFPNVYVNNGTGVEIARYKWTEKEYIMKDAGDQL